MLRFNNDYNEGAHESILKKLAEINMNQIGGYGEDEYCDEARDIIKKYVTLPVRTFIFSLAEHRQILL